MLGSRILFGNAQQRRCYELASILAWAAERGIPFEAALAPLRESGRRHAWKITATSLGGLCLVSLPHLLLYLPSCAVVPLDFQASVRGLIHQLEDGRSLGEALRTKMRGVMPCWYIDAVLAAEAAGNAETVLPVLRKALRGSEVPQDATMFFLRTYLYPPIAMTIFLVLLYTFIFPKWRRMQMEMLGGAELWHVEAMQWLLREAPNIGVSYWWVFPLVLFILYLANGIWDSICTYIEPKDVLPQARKGVKHERPGVIRILIPRARKLYRLRQQATLLRYFQIGLETGKSMDATIDWIALTTRNRIIRRQLLAFKCCLLAGTTAALAWSETMDDPAGVNWIVANGFAREEPGQGFGLAADQANYIVRQSDRTSEKRMAIGVIAFQAIPTAATAYIIFSTLSALVSGVGVG